MGEHSPCDALIPSIVADYAVTQSITPETFSQPEPAPFSTDRDLDIGGWERLDWVTDARIKAECIAAESRAKNLIADSDDSVLWFSDYGTEWIKSIGTSNCPSPPPLLGATLMRFGEYSLLIPGRIRADGPSTSLVQDARMLYGHVRNCAYAYIRQSPHGDDSYAQRGQPRMGLGHD